MTQAVGLAQKLHEFLAQSLAEFDTIPVAEDYDRGFRDALHAVAALCFPDDTALNQE